MYACNEVFHRSHNRDIVGSNGFKQTHVDQCIVVQKKIKNYENHLVAVLKLNKKMSESKIINLASKELPHYMIPSKFIIKNKIPINSNGKIDRRKIADAI